MLAKPNIRVGVWERAEAAFLPENVFLHLMTRWPLEEKDDYPFS